MKRIRYLTIRFGTTITLQEIPTFRGAVIEKVGREHDLFHNHDAQAGFLYRYPLIQYKRVGSNPAIICLDEGVDEIHHFFQNRSWDITLYDRPIELSVQDLRLNQFTFQAWEHTFSFTISNWLALNQENYDRFMALAHEQDQVSFLERILRSNILSMAKGLDWYIDREVRVRIRSLGPMHLQRFKDQLLASFDAHFDTNVFLPNLIGLGKGASIGFGVVKQKRREERKIAERDKKDTHTTQHDDEY